ncbi:MAG TPA: hypothetical protein VEJ18_15630, partial [Planctomycetota bacterium]|nr:hypothetical protein [Planctomycetota bacterium]
MRNRESGKKEARPAASRAGAALLLPLALVGCLDYAQDVTLFPDGSGMITRTLGVKRDALNLLRALTKGKGAPADPLRDFADLDRLKEASRGIAAWGRPERSSAGGWDSVRVTAFFEDVDQVRLFLVQESDGVLERRLEFAAKRREGPSSHVLEIDPTSRDAVNPDDPRLKPLLALMGEAKVRFTVRVPGTIVRAEGFAEAEGRTATLLF